MKIKWGVIGCGGIAYRRTIPGLMLAENSELVAVMDTNFEAAQKTKEEFGAKYAFATDEEVLALDEIENYEDITGINDNYITNVNVYPNPVNDRLYIETQTLTQTLTVEIYDVYGRHQVTETPSHRVYESAVNGLC